MVERETVHVKNTGEQEREGAGVQQGEHEIISDDGLMQLYFTQVDASNELLPAHWHEHLEMICMQHGAMTAYINETSYELQQGDILVVNPRHSLHACPWGRALLSAADSAGAFKARQ